MKGYVNVETCLQSRRRTVKHVNKGQDCTTTLIYYTCLWCIDILNLLYICLLDLWCP